MCIFAPEIVTNEHTTATQLIYSIHYHERKTYYLSHGSDDMHTGHGSEEEKPSAGIVAGWHSHPRVVQRHLTCRRVEVG